MKLHSHSLFTSLLLTPSQICGIHISDPSCCEVSNFLTSSAELLLFEWKLIGTVSDALESLPISPVFSSGRGSKDILLECLLGCSFKPSTGISFWRVLTFLKDELSSLALLSYPSEDISHDRWHNDLEVASCWRKLCINVLTLQNMRIKMDFYWRNVMKQDLDWPEDLLAISPYWTLNHNHMTCIFNNFQWWTGYSLQIKFITNHIISLFHSKW